MSQRQPKGGGRGGRGYRKDLVVHSTQYTHTTRSPPPHCGTCFTLRVEAQNFHFILYFARYLFSNCWMKTTKVYHRRWSEIRNRALTLRRRFLGKNFRRRFCCCFHSSLFFFTSLWPDFFPTFYPLKKKTTLWAIHRTTSLSRSLSSLSRFLTPILAGKCEKLG